MAKTNETGVVTGAFLSNPNLENRFYLAKSFSQLDSAKTFFSSFTHNPDSAFTQIAFPAEPFQIWVVKTNELKFGKILIHDASAEEVDQTPYAEVTFEWQLIAQ